MIKKNSKAPVYYPILFNVKGKRCIVVGGGKVALRKIRMLLNCQADVTVISPMPHPEIVMLSKKRMIRLIQRDYEVEDLEGAVVAIAATDVKEINRQVASEAKKVGVLVNVVDDPERSDFIIPSFFRRGNLTITVSTGGVSPALARKIRTELEKSFGEEYVPLLSLIGEVRSTKKKKGIRVDEEVWQEALDLDLLIRLIQAGKRKEAKSALLEKIEAHS